MVVRILVQIGIFQHVAYSGIYFYVLFLVCIAWYVTICTELHVYKYWIVCNDMYWTCFGLYWSALVCLEYAVYIFKYALICISTQ